MAKKHDQHKDPVHFPKVALVYEGKFKKSYELMLKNMDRQLAEKIKKTLKSK